MVLGSERLWFRKITQNDYEPIAAILQNEEVMYAWEHAFVDDEVQEWIDKNLARYAEDGFSYFAVIEKDTNAFIGMMGPLVEKINEEKQIGLAYILDKKHWGRGYAVEGAKVCMAYAFDVLKADQVIAQIRPNNHPSRRVAEKLGMKIQGEYIKHYNGMEMPHLIYSRSKEQPV